MEYYRTRVIVISSLARDVLTYPSPGYYVVPLDDTIRDVVSIELVYGLYDRVTTDRFVSLIIREASSSDLISNCNTARHAFTQLPMIRTINEYTSKNFRSKHMYSGGPLAKLDRLTIGFSDPRGKLYPMHDHLLRFELIHRV